MCYDFTEERRAEEKRQDEQYQTPTPSRVTRSSIPILFTLLHSLSCHGLTVALNCVCASSRSRISHHPKRARERERDRERGRHDTTQATQLPHPHALSSPCPPEQRPWSLRHARARILAARTLPAIHAVGVRCIRMSYSSKCSRYLRAGARIALTYSTRSDWAEAGVWAWERV